MHGWCLRQSVRCLARGSANTLPPHARTPLSVTPSRPSALLMIIASVRSKFLLD